jgi:hypothetical protein
MIATARRSTQASSRILGIVANSTPAPNIRVGADRAADRPFASFGEQLVAAVQAGMPGRRGSAPRAREFAGRAQFMAGSRVRHERSVGSEGGFFIQPDLLPGVIDPVYAEDPILSRVTRIPIGSKSSGVKYNVVDETARTTGNRWGGIQMYWAAEADGRTASKPKLRQMQLDLKKLIGLGVSHRRADAGRAGGESLLTRAFQAELAFMLGRRDLRGHRRRPAAGLPQLGRAHHAGDRRRRRRSPTPRSSSRKRDEDAVARAGVALGRVIWLYNQELLPYLLNATLGGTSRPGLHVRSADSPGRPNDTILGRPAYASELCEAVGTPGDILCVVPSQYHMADKGGPQQATRCTSASCTTR